MMDWSELEVDALEGAKGPFDGGEPFVGGDQICGGGLWIRHLRPDDVESIQLGFVLDTRFVARPRTGIIGDGDIEMLADFVSGERGCDGASDQGRATQGSLGASDAISCKSASVAASNS